MKFFYLVPSKKFEEIKPFLSHNQNDNVLNSNTLPPNKTLNLYDDAVRRNNFSTSGNGENLQTEDIPTNKKDNEGATTVLNQPELEKSSHSRNDRSMIIPLYINTLSKLHRDVGKNVINDLISREIVSIEDDGTIKSKYSSHEVSMETFLRSLFAKNASLKETKEFLMDIKSYLPINVIENTKVLNLLGKESTSTSQKGGSLIPQKVWCLYRNF